MAALGFGIQLSDWWSILPVKIQVRTLLDSSEIGRPCLPQGTRSFAPLPKLKTTYLQ